MIYFRTFFLKTLAFCRTYVLHLSITNQNTPLHFTSLPVMSQTADRNTWATDPTVFAPWHTEFCFTVDACALDWNAKLPRYFTPEVDGLAQSWAGERVWCNPPYGRGLIKPWVDKALRHEAELTVLLLPSRTDTDWFQAALAAGVYIRFLPKRIRFIPPPGVKASSPTEASLLLIVKA